MQAKSKPSAAVRKRQRTMAKKSAQKRQAKFQRAVAAGFSKLVIAARNLPMIATGFGVLTCVDLFTAGHIFGTEHRTLNLFGAVISLALLKVGFVWGAGLLGFLGSARASMLKYDPRPEQQRRAYGARVTSLLLLLIPIAFFAEAMAFPAQQEAREAYLASDVYLIDQAMAKGQCYDAIPGQDCYVSDQEQADAIVSLRQADEVKTAQMDGVYFTCLFGALFIYGVVWSAGAAFYAPAPETRSEARERVRAARAAKTQETKLANLKARQRSPWSFPAPKFNLVGWLKSARA